ncbi:MAG: hypothetical protein K1X75_13165 [Leptospirales bacterium]|nr:hypothetical protein [Leptospirales bacterium]
MIEPNPYAPPAVFPLPDNAWQRVKYRLASALLFFAIFVGDPAANSGVTGLGILRSAAERIDFQRFLSELFEEQPPE